MNLHPIKEGKTPTEFLSAWSSGFSAVLLDKKDTSNKEMAEYFMIICDEAIKKILNLYPQTITQPEVIEGLNKFITYFQKGVIETGGNAWEAQKRINFIREAIATIQAKKPKVVVVQASLF